MTCHRIEVPADWSDIGGETLSLPIMFLPATESSAHPDPIVIPAGGPSSSGTSGVVDLAGFPLNLTCDVILSTPEGIRAVIRDSVYDVVENRIAQTPIAAERRSMETLLGSAPASKVASMVPVPSTA